MILPKGILENTREIYAEVASYDVVPPEKIWQYWNGEYREHDSAGIWGSKLMSLLSLHNDLSKIG